jgi:hypothetical protein
VLSSNTQSAGSVIIFKSPVTLYDPLVGPTITKVSFFSTLNLKSPFNLESTKTGSVVTGFSGFGLRLSSTHLFQTSKYPSG